MTIREMRALGFRTERGISLSGSDTRRLTLRYRYSTEFSRTRGPFAQCDPRDRLVLVIPAGLRSAVTSTLFGVEPVLPPGRIAILTIPGTAPGRETLRSDRSTRVFALQRDRPDISESFLSVSKPRRCSIDGLWRPKSGPVGRSTWWAIRTNSIYQYTVYVVALY